MSTVPPPATPPVPVSVTGEPFAGFWIRVAAAIVDGLVLLVPNIIINMVFPVTIDSAGIPHNNPFAMLLTIAMYVAYYACFNGGAWQATPGKRLVGIHLIKADGGNVSYARAVGRYFATWLSGLIFMVGFIMVAFTREKTGLHDLICDTRVVYGKR